MLLDEFGVVVDLRFVAGELLITIGGNAGIGSHPPFGNGSHGDRCKNVSAGARRSQRIR